MSCFECIMTRLGITPGPHSHEAFSRFDKERLWHAKYKISKKEKRQRKWRGEPREKVMMRQSNTKKGWLIGQEDFRSGNLWSCNIHYCITVSPVFSHFHSRTLWQKYMCLCAFLPAGRALRQLVIRLLSCFPFVCMYVCIYVCVCVRPQILRALSYVIPLLCHYSHERSGSYWKFVGSIGQGTSS